MSWESPARTDSAPTMNVPEVTAGGDKLNRKVAHDLRNVLTGLIGHLSLLREHPGLPRELADQISFLENAALKARALSHELGVSQPELSHNRVQTQTEFKPQTSAPAPVPAAQTASAAPAKRILAMDDEPGIRTLLSAALSHFGYEAITVPNGSEALDEYKRALSENHPFSAVIMDLTVPGGMGGKEAIKALKEFDPSVKAIVSSGYSSDPAIVDFKSFGFVARVEKPYRIQELGQVLRTTLQN